MALFDEILAETKRTKAASRLLAKLPSVVKNRALLKMADDLISASDFLVTENAKDIDTGKKKGLTEPLLERLTLTPKRIATMSEGLKQVAALPDPVGEILGMKRLENGLQVGQMRGPIGVIGIIYESRPNVTADVAGLCIKSGNGVILRGGSEAIYSNTAIAKILEESGASAGLPPHVVSLIKTTDRQAIYELLKMEQTVDLIIPRGGEGLIRTVVEHSKIPVMKHDKGICHTYIDESADIEMAEEIALNAKVQRPSVCNAMETLLVHTSLAATFLPRFAKRLQAAGGTIYGCEKTLALLQGEIDGLLPAEESDWYAEYLDLRLAVKIVASMEEAIQHIEAYGSEHSEAIVTRDHPRAMRFLNEVDASAVFINSSTRFSDGFQLGLGAEMGISTSRIHARGPMGLTALTTAKFIVLGDGQVRS